MWFAGQQGSLSVWMWLGRLAVTRTIAFCPHSGAQRPSPPSEHVMHDGTPTSFVIRASANCSLIAQARYIHSFRSFPRVFIVSVGHIPRVAYHHDAANQRNLSGRGMYWIGRQHDVMIPSPILRWWFWFAGCWVCCPTSVRLGSSVICNNPQQKT